MKHLTTAKAGDQVRPVPTGFLANGLYTVKEVRLISGAPWLFLVGLDSSMFAPECFLPPEPRYSESFTKRAVAEPTTGHAPDSPIQKHSLGDIYPLAVVGYGSGNHVMYCIENLSNGGVLAHSSGVRQWFRAHEAEAIARQVADGKTHDGIGDLFVWRAGRPALANGRLTLMNRTVLK